MNHFLKLDFTSFAKRFEALVLTLMYLCWRYVKNYFNEHVSMLYIVYRIYKYLVCTTSEKSSVFKMLFAHMKFVIMSNFKTTYVIHFWWILKIFRYKRRAIKIDTVFSMFIHRIDIMFNMFLVSNSVHSSGNAITYLANDRILLS